MDTITPRVTGPGPIVLILNRDPAAPPVMLCRCPHPANRSHTIRRRWLREIHAATVASRDVLAVDMTC
ncbi:MAG: hypothetical protein WC058_08805 [Phycisphaeraceae bacterium]